MHRRRRVMLVDLRRLEPYVTGIGRTLRESTSLIAPTDEVLVRARIPGIPGRQSVTFGDPRYVTVEAFIKRIGRDRVWQPWAFGPLGRRKTLVGVYDLIPLRLGRAKSRLLIRRLATIRRDHRAHILTLHEATSQRLSHDFAIDPSRVHVAHPGVNLSARPSARDFPRESVLLVVGRSSTHKNLAWLLETWVACGRPGHLRFILPFVDANSRLAQDARRNGVQILHSLSDEDLTRQMQTCAALISPSLEEGYGLPLVEAAQQQSPIIASDIPPYRSAPVLGACLLPLSRPSLWGDAMWAAVGGELRAARLAAHAPTWNTWRAQLAEGMRRTFEA